MRRSAIHERLLGITKPGHRRLVWIRADARRGAAIASATPDCRPASVTFEHVAARWSAFSPGASRSDRRSSGDAEQRRPSARASRPAGSSVAGSSPASMHAWSSSTMCCFHLAREREALVLAADARDRAVDEHQREVLRLLAAELVEAPESRRGRARAAAAFLSAGVVADASPGRRAAGSPPRRARRRCRPCWGSSRRWRPGCIRCARRSCGSRRSGSPR